TPGVARRWRRCTAAMRPQPIRPTRIGSGVSFMRVAASGGGEIAPELVVQGTTLRTLREELPLLQRAAEGPVGVVVPDALNGLSRTLPKSTSIEHEYTSPYGLMRADFHG